MEKQSQGKTSYKKVEQIEWKVSKMKQSQIELQPSIAKREGKTKANLMKPRTINLLSQEKQAK